MSDDTPTERFDQVPEEPLPRTRPLPIQGNNGGSNPADDATERLDTSSSFPTERLQTASNAPTERLSASPAAPTERLSASPFPAGSATPPAPGGQRPNRATGKPSRRPAIIPLIIVAIALVAGIGFAATLIGDNGSDPVVPPIDVSTESPSSTPSPSESEEETEAPAPSSTPKPTIAPTPKPTVTATPVPTPTETPIPEPTVIETPVPTITEPPVQEPEPTLTSGPIDED